MRGKIINLSTGTPSSTVNWTTGRQTNFACETDGTVKVSWGDGTTFGKVTDLTNDSFHSTTVAQGVLKFELTTGTTATIVAGRSQN